MKLVSFKNKTKCAGTRRTRELELFEHGSPTYRGGFGRKITYRDEVPRVKKVELVVAAGGRTMKPRLKIGLGRVHLHYPETSKVDAKRPGGEYVFGLVLGP